MNKKIIIIPVAIVLILAVFVTRSCKARNGKAIKLSGNIEITDAQIGFKVQGRMEERYVSEGESITNGQIIAKLDDAELRQIVAKAEAGLDIAKAEAEKQKLEYARQEELFKGKVTSDREFQMAKAANLMSEARVKEAIASLELAKTRLSDAVLRSHMDGLVLSDTLETGEFATPGMPVVTIGNLKDVWLRCYVGETDMGRVKPGQKAAVTVDSFPGKVFKGTVSFISSQSEFTPKNIQTTKERVKLVYRIKIDIKNPDIELKPGMPADAELQ